MEAGETQLKDDFASVNRELGDTDRLIAGIKQDLKKIDKLQESLEAHAKEMNDQFNKTDAQIEQNMNSILTTFINTTKYKEFNELYQDYQRVTPVFRLKYYKHI